MTCNRDTTRCRYISKCCHENLVDMLGKLEDIFQKNMLRHWLCFGTLIGSLRNGSFIPWDEDIDLGVLSRDFSLLMSLMPQIYDLGFLPTKTTIIDRHSNTWNIIADKVEIPTTKKFIVLNKPIYLSKKNDLHIDIFAFGNNEEMAWCWEAPGFSYPLKSLFYLDEVEFEGIRCPIPSNPEIGLKSYYGDDWNTPKVKKWMMNYVNPNDKELMEEISGYESYD